MSANSGPGYSKHPEHRIEVKPAGLRVRVTFNGEVIADTRDALELKEGDYPVVYYVPRKDVKMDRLIRSAAIARTARSRARRRISRCSMDLRTPSGVTSSPTTRCLRSRSSSRSIPTRSTRSPPPDGRNTDGARVRRQQFVTRFRELSRRFLLGSVNAAHSRCLQSLPNPPHDDRPERAAIRHRAHAESNTRRCCPGRRPRLPRLPRSPTRPGWSSAEDDMQLANNVRGQPD